MIKKAALQNNPALATKFTIICIFAAAVNKSTVESLISTNEMADIRGVIGSSFSIQGKPNMSALSLCGHAMLTSRFCDRIVFAQKFREKIGQSDIWDRELSKDRLSEKQHEIFNQKKRNNPAESAKLLGNGFFKVAGMNSEALTADETTFWGVAPSTAVTGSIGNSGTTSVVLQTRAREQTVTTPPAVQPEVPAVPSARKRGKARDTTPTGPQAETIAYSDSKSATVSGPALEYFRTVLSSDPNALSNAIAKDGAAAFEARMAKLREKDPEMRNRIDLSKYSTV